MHSLHMVLEHQQDELGVELSAGWEAAVGWVNLPDMTEMLLERVRAVHLALDSACLARATTKRSGRGMGETDDAWWDRIARVSLKSLLAFLDRHQN
jgi:hypothetical protein